MFMVCQTADSYGLGCLWYTQTADCYGLACKKLSWVPQTADGYGLACNRLLMVPQLADSFGLGCVGYPKQPTATGWSVSGTPNSRRLRAGLQPAV